MTLGKLIERVRQIYENTFPDGALAEWTAELDGRILREDFLRKEFKIEYDAEADADTVLLLETPWDEMYVYHMLEKIHFYRGEYEDARNMAEQWQAIHDDWLRNMLSTTPVDGLGRPLLHNLAVVRAGSDGRVHMKSIFGVNDIYRLTLYVVQNDAVMLTFNESSSQVLLHSGNWIMLNLTAADTAALNVGGAELIAEIETVNAEHYESDPLQIRVLKSRLGQTGGGTPGGGEPGGDDTTGGETEMNGVTFTPHVDENGNLSWTNDGGLENPEIVNIMGPAGANGATPVKGTDYWTEDDKQEIISAAAEQAGAASGGGYTQLSQMTVAEEQQMVSIDLSNVQWSQWQEVVIDIFYDSVVTTEGKIYVNQDKNNNQGTETYGCTMWPPSSTSYMMVEESLGRIGKHRGRLKILCGGHPETTLETELRTFGSTRPYIGWNSGITLGQIETIDYYNYSKVPVGVVITVYGVK